MTSQSSHAAGVCAPSEHGHEGTKPAPDAPASPPQKYRPSARPFVWNSTDCVDAGWIACMCGMARAVDHGEVIMEATAELNAGRRPRLVDAWRFFHAAAVLAKSGQSVIAAKAQQIGARIALHVTGFTVVNMCWCEAGSSGALSMALKDRDDFVTVFIRPGTELTTLDAECAR